MVHQVLKELLLAYRRDRATLLDTYTTQINLHPEAPNTVNWNGIQTIRESIAFVEHNIRDLELGDRPLTSVPGADIDFVSHEWNNRFPRPLSAERLEEHLFEVITIFQEHQGRRKTQHRIMEYEATLEIDRTTRRMQQKTREQWRRKLERQRKRGPLRTRRNQQVGRRQNVLVGGPHVKLERGETPRGEGVVLIHSSPPILIMASRVFRDWRRATWRTGSQNRSSYNTGEHPG